MSYGPNVFHKDAEDLARILSTPNVWSPPSVKDEPKTPMTRWGIRECFTDHYGERTRHLVGYTGSGRVSSKVVNFEVVDEGLLATTNSGRKYLLKGSPGMNLDAEYVWGTWTGMHKATDIKDVTDEYFDHEKATVKVPA
jgi:hypothetical protein